MISTILFCFHRDGGRGRQQAEPVPLQECPLRLLPRTVRRAQCAAPLALEQVLVPAPPSCRRGGGGISNRGPSDRSMDLMDPTIYRSCSISMSSSTLAVKALWSLPDGLMTFPASWLLSNASSLCFSSLFSILMLEILSNLAFKFPKRKHQIGPVSCHPVYNTS